MTGVKKITTLAAVKLLFAARLQECDVVALTVSAVLRMVRDECLR